MKAISESTKALAKKAGKLPKAPKKPKANASLTSLEGYKTRHAAYVKKINELASKARKKESLKKQIFG
jgi:hypothetical protein